MRMRRVIARIVIGLLVGVVVTPIGLAVSERPAAAASFNPGMIISDGVFFNPGAMDANGVQSFLNARVRACSSGAVCLKDYRQDTWTRAADPMCRSYTGARNESAATIIAKVGAACGINPQVLLVLLEKEQSLVRDTNPTARQYRVATGYGCPDTAPCDQQYYGFYNQVYMAAWAFKRYTMPAGTGPGTQWSTRFDLMYPVGRTSNILYNPNRACGTQAVTIQNQATHALYVYTPYVPNAAALAAGYGRGDGCSAYGNRNFFLLFSDWFGSTGFVVEGALGDYYRATGGASGPLGEPIGAMQTVAGGWKQNFQRGVLFAEAGQPVRFVKGAILGRYDVAGLQAGRFGWPRGNETQVAGGWTQTFQSGVIFSSAAGTFGVGGAIGQAYTATGAQNGPHGWPTSDESGVGGSWSQNFENATLSHSRATFAVEGRIRDRYVSMGAAAGLMGAAGESMRIVSGGWEQRFAGGTIFVSNTGRAFAVKGDIGRLYADSIRSASLGVPTSEEAAIRGGWYQDFAGGRIYSSGSGTFVVRGQLLAAYVARGGSTSDLGWPEGDAVTSGGALSQMFNRGALTVSENGVIVVKGAIGEYYRASDGVVESRFGIPVAAEVAERGGWSQAFRNGVIVSSLRGTFGIIEGGESMFREVRADLGWPVSAPLRRTDAGSRPLEVWQQFEAGGIGGATTTTRFQVRGAIASHYDAIGAANSTLGLPTGPETAVPGGWFQTFENGRILVKQGRSAVVVQGSIEDYYLAAGGPAGALAWPLSGERRLGSGWLQSFDGGVVTVVDGRTNRVLGAIGTAYAASGSVTGSLGFPLENERADGSGWAQRFQGGVIAVTPEGTFTVRGAIGVHYLELGADEGALGVPTGPERRTVTGWTQAFRNGVLVAAEGGSVTRR